MTTALSLRPRDDLDKLARVFATVGRVEMRDLLGEGQAERLRDHLSARDDWTTVLNAGDKVYELPRAGLRAMTAEQRGGLDTRVAASARDGFQYRYEAIRVPDAEAARAAPGDPLTDFVRFIGSAPVLALLEAVTGLSGMTFADGQATAYSDGHFLTRHDDDVAGKGRRAAYVFGLSPAWRAEWGGLLMFHRDDGNIAEAFVPAMGALRLFAVPVSHSVSYVTPFAPEPRLAITGWLRTAAPQSSA